ncbi:NADH-quinone oxidoreductase subunit C [Streptomyces sp. NBC_01255]|uniref:NADH-quinone oxidoreductase subunit C n=1 Tax=Streptomyces sp. NBC_01255 TaxID=2903798 RepID=UPI002E35E0A3|nr:NADH-quinone oxidoreductase subunit C [Streptomyces sp. NBC_01255]
MSTYDSLPDSVTEIFGEEATAERAYDLLTVDVPPAAWITALTTARDELGCTYFDWLSAVDEPGTGFRVCAHVVALSAGHPPRRLLVRTTVPHAAPALPTAIGVYAGAGWHERETHEMFGVDFTGHPHLVPLLLPENFEGHPLRKDFVLAARVAKAWPGAKEPGESHDGGGPKRRQMLPPGVPDPNEWGPLKGQLPPAPARPARATAGDRPARRTRSVTEGSATQPTPDPTSAPEAAARPPRRSRSVTEGSASQTTPEATTAPEPEAQPPAADGPAPASPTARPPRRARTTADGSASQTTPDAGTPPEPQAPAPAADGAAPAAPTARPPRRAGTAADGSASQAAPEQDATADGPATATPRTRSSDAPWHHARPAFDKEPPEPEAPGTAAAEPTEAATPAEPEAPATPATPATPAEAEPSAQDPAQDPAQAPAPESGPPAGREESAPTEPTDPAGGDPA